MAATTELPTVSYFTGGQPPMYVADDPGAVGSASSSVEKALAVLEAFRGHGAVLGVSELAKRAGLPKSTTHRLLSVLASRGYVARQDNRYYIGDALFELGSLARHCRPRGIRAVAMPHMLELARATGATVQLGVRSGQDVLLIESLPGEHCIHGHPTVGARLPAARSALGRAMLAFHPNHVAEGDPHSAEPGGAALERALGRIREYGLAVEDRRGVLTYAAPVSRLGQDGTAAALSITWYAKPQTARRVEHEFRRSVAAISRDLGASISA